MELFGIHRWRVLRWTIALVFFSSMVQAEPHCIWYDQCGDQMNCNYTGPPKELNDSKAVGLLREMCPQMMSTDSSEFPLTCCSAKQVYTLNSNMTIARSLLSRCPSCMKNFLNLFCHSTCSPEQSNFMAVNPADITEKQQIKTVYYAVSESFVYGMFNSCKDVQNPSSGKPALSMLCGREAAQCTPQNWLGFLGDKSKNPNFVPFNIYFKISANASMHLDVLNLTLSPMNDTSEPCAGKCTCQDCSSSCKPIEPDVLPVVPMILGFDRMEFIMACVFLTFLIVFGTAQICMFFYGSKQRSHRELSLNADYELQQGNDQLRKPNCYERLGAAMEDFFERQFGAWGYFCARRPVIVIPAALFLCVVLSIGIVFFKVTTDPVELWSAPDSQARQEKDYFDNNFSPFYRTEMLIVEAKNSSQWLHDVGQSLVLVPQLFGPVLREDVLLEVLDLQTKLASLTAWSDKLQRNITLEDICFSPLYPDNPKCAIMSALNYYQNNPNNLAKWMPDDFGWVGADYTSHFSICTKDPLTINDLPLNGVNLSCLADFGAPIMPWVVLGGYPGENYENASALVITFLVNNFKNETFQEMATAWEKEFINFMMKFEGENITVNFSTERSIQDELNRESQSDILTILASYIIMFIYVSLMLGQYNSCSKLLVHSKMLLGLSGVIIVLLSVTSSIGFYSYIGIPATLIIIEVVPFLVLAVGVDNIFILVQTYQRTTMQKGETVEQMIGRVVGKVGPTMMLTSFSESLAFFLAALMDMPAVKVFALYGALAVFIDFLLQISLFISLLTLDAKRQHAGRPECCCCVKSEEPEPMRADYGLLHKFVKKVYAKIFLNSVSRPVVMVAFVGWLCVCISVVDKIEIGLDQKLAVPKDSYVLKYFTAMEKYLSVGSPLYFVVGDGHNYSTVFGQNEICGSSGCPSMSLLSQVYEATRKPNSSCISYPPSSWLDDYFDWVDPGSSCCRQFRTNNTFCRSTVADDNICVPCNVTQREKGRPVSADFNKYLPWFLEDNPGVKCPKGGHAAYGSAVKLDSNGNVGASYFMTYHTVLKTSSDFIKALKFARELGDNITQTLLNWNTTHADKKYAAGFQNVTAKVFPYSVFYVFYEQYLDIVPEMIFNLGLCGAAIFGMTFVLLGFDLWTSTIIIITIAMILASMLGMMYFWSIALNAVSLVNLVMTIGIAVEFCSHIARAFALSTRPTRVQRAEDAFVHMGTSVLSGITLTKLGGIAVLAFSKSQLFQVFYFRMYTCIVVFGALHGLFFLPVFLSYFGPPVNAVRSRRKRIEQRDDSDDNVPIVSNHFASTDSSIYASNDIIYDGR